MNTRERTLANRALDLLIPEAAGRIDYYRLRFKISEYQKDATLPVIGSFTVSDPSGYEVEVSIEFRETPEDA